MKTFIKTLIFAILLVFACGVDLTWDGAPDLTFARDAEAFIGRPLTPMSFAGVARRTTRRRVVWGGAAVAASTATVAAASASAYNAQEQAAVASQQAAIAQQQAATAQQQAAATHATSGVPVGTVVTSLPAGCKSFTVSGTDYHDCGGSFYKAAFQGNNLVYVTVANPL